MYAKAQGQKILHEKKQGEWLFHGFHETLYHLLYKNPESETLCGINCREYRRYCKLLHIPPEQEKIIAYRIEAILIIIICMLLAWLCSYSIFASMFFALVGATAATLLWVLPYGNIKSRAEERLFHISDDLPRFLSLLEKAMGLPIDQAMMTTASKFESPLSDDIIDSINKVSLGASGWQSMLMDLARTYDMPEFSDLVLEILSAYDQGTDIRPLVNRKAYEIEQVRLYKVEEHDSKIKTLIFLPIIALKILPLMAMICLPMITNFV